MATSRPQQLIERHWQRPHAGLSLLLWPLARLFQAASGLRLLLYRTGCLKRVRLPVPVVVVGNIHVGGVGKTPVVAALVQGLQQRGIRVGIVSRGYGRSNRATLLVDAQGQAADYGDEPLLLAQQTGAPVAVGRSRAAAGRLLLAQHPQTELIITDDGLQHLALARDVEIVVYPAADSQRVLDVLPNGPLRERVRRLRTVDALVFSGLDQTSGPQPAPPSWRLPETVSVHHASLAADWPYRLNQKSQRLRPDDVAGQTVVALAGIGRPQKFFDTVHAMGFAPAQTIALPDHYPLTSAALPVADVLIITEKDAVKLAGQNCPNVWVLPVCAIIKPDLAERVLRLLPAISSSPQSESYGQ